MEAMADLFDRVNSMLGVEGPGELMFSPYFLGLLAIMLIYSLIKGMKFFSVITAGMLSGAAIYHYMYPKDSSDLGGLIVFFACIGGLVLVLVYFAFVRE